MDLTIKLAHYILTIAQEQNITRAAMKLYISQPSLTQAMQKAEHQLGEKLFYRDGNTVLPTRFGQKVVSACGRLVKLSRDLENELEDELHSFNNQVILGMPYNLGVHMFPRLFTIYQQEYPNVKLVPIEEPSLELEKHLLSGFIDVALIPLPLPIQSNQLSTKPLIHERMLVTIKKGHSIRKKAVDIGLRYPAIHLTDLENEPFVLGPPKQRIRVFCEQLFKLAKFEPNIAYVSKNIDGQRMMAASGVGFTICPEHYQEFYPLREDVDLFYLLPPCDLCWDVVMVYRTDSYLSVPTRECCKILSRFAQGTDEQDNTKRTGV